MKVRKLLCGGVLAVVVGCGGTAFAAPLGTAFTYQGQLKKAGLPLDDMADFQFTLWDAVAGGTQIGGLQTVSNVEVTAGLFTVALDPIGEFGVSAFNGSARWLQIAVRITADGGNFTTLTPRQPLTAAPHALFALNAATATNATNATTATNATQLNGQPAVFYQNASNISSGTLADARLGPNVAVLNTAQTFSAAKTFSQAPSFSAAGAPFTVSSNTLVMNLNADRLDGLESAAFLQNISGIAAGGDLSGTYPSPTIANNAVTSSKIQDGAIMNVDLANSAVTDTKIANDSVSSSKIVDGSVTTADLADNSVTSPEIMDGTIVAADLANSAVTNSKLADNSVNSSKIADGSVTTADLADNSVTSPEIMDGTIVAADLANSAVATSKIANAAVTPAKIDPTGAATGNSLTYNGTSVVWGSPAATLALPFSGTTSTGAGISGFKVTNSGGHGVEGIASGITGYGVIGRNSGAGVAVYGYNPDPAGVAGYFQGRLHADGVEGYSGGTGPAVQGYADGTGHGVEGVAASTGVYGHATAPNGATSGVFGECDSADGTGVFGSAPAGGFTNYGVRGLSYSSSGIGVYGAVYEGTGTNYGVRGETFSPDGYAGYFSGRGYFSGSVGIGTPSPDGMLHISSSDSTQLVLQQTTPGYAQLLFAETDGTGVASVSYDNLNDQLYLANGGVARLFVSNTGNVGIGATPHPAFPLIMGSGALCTPGGMWTNASSRALKENFANVNSRDVLDRVVDLPIRAWNYKNENNSVRHIGPMAEEFHEQFGLGVNDKSIGTIDAEGVALAAIQGLYQIVQDKDCEITEMREKITKLETMMNQLIVQTEGGSR